MDKAKTLAPILPNGENISWTAALADPVELRGELLTLSNSEAGGVMEFFRPEAAEIWPILKAFAEHGALEPPANPDPED